MKKIGVTGGIGTGKSTVANILRERGWPVLDSDVTAREIMSQAPVVVALAEVFGNGIVMADGRIDRAALAALVFGDTLQHAKRLKQLEGVVHPLVRARHTEQFAGMEQAGSPLVVLDSPLLYEMGLDEAVDYVIVVDAPDDVRIARVQSRSGLTREQIQARMDQQMSMLTKRSRADFVIDNAHDIDALRKSVHAIADILELLPDSEM